MQRKQIVGIIGGLEIYQLTGFEGYELAAYIGAFFGGIFDAILGVKLAIWIDSNKKKALKDRL